MKKDDAVTIMKLMWDKSETNRKSQYLMLGAMFLFNLLYATFLLYNYTLGIFPTTFNYVAGIMCVLSLALIFKNAIDARRSSEEVHNLYLEMGLKK